MILFYPHGVGKVKIAVWWEFGFFFICFYFVSLLSIYVMLAVMGKYWLNQLTRFILLMFIALFTFRT